MPKPVTLGHMKYSTAELMQSTKEIVAAMAAADPRLNEKTVVLTIKAVARSLRDAADADHQRYFDADLDSDEDSPS